MTFSRQSVDISLVIPVYNEENGLAALFSRLEENFKALDRYTFEVILVNDGSSDQSLSVLQKLCGQTWEHGHYFYVDLSRNFGKEIALSAGLDYAKGKAIVTMDSDLQHPPEHITNLLEKWEEGFEVVTSVRTATEKKSLFRRVAGTIFYYLIAKTADIKIVSNSTDFRLIDRKVCNYFVKVGEKQRMFRGIVDWLGFKTAYIKFKAAEREFGNASYSTAKLFGLAIDSMVSFSITPLRVIVFLGLFVCLVSGSILAWMLASHFFFPELNYTPLAMFVVLNTLLTGILLSALGLIALYIGKIYGEVLQRPLYAVRETSLD